MKPAGENDFFRKGRRFAGEVGEDELGDVLREVRIASGLPNGGGIDEREVASDEFSERGFGTFFRKTA